MLSINLRRSAATLGVLAGLLIAVAPASAQLPANAGGFTPPIGTNKGSLTAAEQGVWGPIIHVATDPSSEVDNTIILTGTADDNMRHTGSKAPRASSGEVAMESVTQLNDVEAIDLNVLGTQVGSEGVEAPKPPASSEEPTESISFSYLKAAGTETGNPERKGSFHASGGWDPTHALNSQGIALHAVATAVVGGLVPGGAIVSA